MYVRVHGCRWMLRSWSAPCPRGCELLSSLSFSPSIVIVIVIVIAINHIHHHHHCKHYHRTRHRQHRHHLKTHYQHTTTSSHPAKAAIQQRSQKNEPRPPTTDISTRRERLSGNAAVLVFHLYCRPSLLTEQCSNVLVIHLYCRTSLLESCAWTCVGCIRWHVFGRASDASGGMCLDVCRMPPKACVWTCVGGLKWHASGGIHDACAGMRLPLETGFCGYASGGILDASGGIRPGSATYA